MYPRGPSTSPNGVSWRRRRTLSQVGESRSKVLRPALACICEALAATDYDRVSLPGAYSTLSMGRQEHAGLCSQAQRKNTALRPAGVDALRASQPHMVLTWLLHDLCIVLPSVWAERFSGLHCSKLTCPSLVRAFPTCGVHRSVGSRLQPDMAPLNNLGACPWRPTLTRTRCSGPK